MKRYDLEYCSGDDGECYAKLEPSDVGDWVDYDDHLAAISVARKEAYEEARRCSNPLTCDGSCQGASDCAETLIEHNDRIAAEARREAFEEAERHFQKLLTDTPLGAADVHRGNSIYNWRMWALCELRALMEKDAPERPTSDALDPAGMEAAIEAYKSSGCEQTTQAIITAYLKAAKRVG